MERLLADNKLILMEAAIVEQLRHTGSVDLHPSLVNAPLIYDEAGKASLSEIYQGYLEIAAKAELPFLMCTPTWRANRERVQQSGVDSKINIDSARFLQNLRDECSTDSQLAKIGGMIGCKNDSYQPELGLSLREAEIFHQWQIDQLASADVDYLIAVTLPNVQEAMGIAKAMSGTGLPYIISFVISRNGNILDGTSLTDAISLIDSESDNKPLGYMINCAYPGFLCAGSQPATLFDRLIGIQANASSLDHGELDEADALHMDDVTDWGKEMLILNQSYGMKILGGCCGTGTEHLNYITSHAR
jgi:homocysteine S-methyltransferase